MGNLEIASSAARIFGRDFFDARMATAALTPSPNTQPQALSGQELEFDQARTRGEFFIERLDKAPDGDPLTGFKIIQLLQAEFRERGHGKILYDITWYENEAFFMEDTPRPGPVLVSKAPIQGSTDKDYHQQTQIRADYLQNQVYRQTQLPAEYQRAVDQWEQEKPYLGKLMRSDWRQAVIGLAGLEINQTFGESWVEGLFDLVVPFMRNGERRLQNVYSRTNTITSGGALVNVGFFDPVGLYVFRWHPAYAYPSLGVCFSRRLI